MSTLHPTPDPLEDAVEPEDAPPLLTPEELVDYPLRKATRGYAVAEVDDLLDALAGQTERLLGAVEGAREERDAREAALRQLEARVRELEQATEFELAAARRVGEGIVGEARQEADRIAEEGRLRAKEHMEAALRRIRAEEVDLQRRQQVVVDHIATLRQFADDHRGRLVQHLQHELARLDAVVVPPDPETPGLSRDPLLDEPGLGSPAPDVGPTDESSRAAAHAGDARPAPQGSEDPVPPAPWDAVGAARAAMPTAPPAEQDDPMPDPVDVDLGDTLFSERS